MDLSASHLYARPAALGGCAAGQDDADRLLAEACDLEAGRDLRGAAVRVDRLLDAGRCTAPVALLFARMAEELGRDAEALGTVLGALANPSPLPPRTTSSLHFSAAHLLDRLGQYERAFAHATRANAPWTNAYDSAALEGLVADCLEDFTPATLREMARATHGDGTPVFVVGMPRSGSTLVEQVLASHPLVFGAGELEWVPRLWQALCGRVGVFQGRLRDALGRMTPADADAVAAGYLCRLRALCPGAARVVDKDLSNVMHLGLIRSLFPAARVIHCRRDPMDTCLSCYMTDFHNVLPFTCSLPAVAHFHRQTDRLMSHWKRVLDLPILEVEYEAMIGDLGGQARRMIAFLDLPWDARCLQFHRNPRAVTTASRSQVRRPIYTSSIQRWRHYEPWLGPLRQALGP